MKKILLILPAIFLTSCTHHFANMRRFDLDRDDPVELVVIDESPWWSTLGYVDAENRLHVIRTQLDGLGEIRNLYLSPDRRKVILESYGEGHQFLAIYVIEDLIKEHHRGTGFIRAYRTLDPYPDGFWDISWLTDDRVQFSARADMKIFDPETRRGKVTMDETIDVERVWLWYLQKDEFQRLTGSWRIPEDMQ